MEQDFNIPNNEVTAFEDLIPSFKELPLQSNLGSSPEIQLPSSEPNYENDFATLGHLSESFGQENAEIEGLNLPDPLGWDLRNYGQPSLSIGFHPAMAFFPNADGKIVGVMPSLQDTGTLLDEVNGANELDPPRFSLANGQDYWIHMVYDGANETAKILTLEIATDIDTVLTADEKSFIMGKVTTQGGEVVSHEMFINGPEVWGGGASEPSECPLDPKIVGDKLTMTNGTIQPHNPKIGSGTVASDPPIELTITAAGTVYIEGVWTITRQGNTTDGFTIQSTTLGVPEVKYGTLPAEIQPTLDAATGATTTGKQVMNVGTVVSDGAGGWKINGNPTCGHKQWHWCQGSGYTYRPID